MIKAIFFDVGNVLIRTVGQDAHVAAARAVKVPLADFTEVFRSHIRDLAEGRITERAFWYAVAKDLNLPSEKTRKLLPIFNFRKMKVQSLVLSIAKRLRKLGYTVGILSDVVPTHARIIGKTVYSHFAPVLLSYRTGISKRKKEAFKLAARRARVKYSEMMFIDDIDGIVAMARKLGIKAFVYKNPAQLLRKLRRLGIRV